MELAYQELDRVDLSWLLDLPIDSSSVPDVPPWQFFVAKLVDRVMTSLPFFFAEFQSLKSSSEPTFPTPQAKVEQ